MPGDHGKLVTGIPGGISGVYSITSPSGRTYVGSSNDIRRRWYEHHWRMKNGKSSSPSLDRAFKKYGLLMKFEILEICAVDDLRKVEQKFIDLLQPSYNVSKDAACAAKWIEANAQDGLRVTDGRKKAIAMISSPVEDSDGRVYPSILQASRANGLSDSSLRRRLKNHDPIESGLRFRLLGEPWKPLRKSANERRSEGRIAAHAEAIAAGKPWKHSDEAKRAKSERSKGVPWSPARREAFAKRKDAERKAAGTGDTHAP